MIALGRYLIGLSIAANQLVNALTGGSPIETLSSRAGSARAHGSTVGATACAVLNLIDHRHERPGEDHCAKALRHFDERRALRTVDTYVQLLEIPALPDAWDVVPGEQLAPAVARLTAWAAHRGIAVVDGPLSARAALGEAFGRQITLNADLATANTRFHTLVHELTHVLGPKTGDVGMDETLAELTAVQVCAALGVDSTRETAAYLYWMVRPATQRAAVTRYAPDIDNLVALFTKAASERK